MYLPRDLLIGVSGDHLPVENERTVREATELWLELNPESPSNISQPHQSGSSWDN